LRQFVELRRRASCACATPQPVIEGAVRVIGANEASWEDLQAVFGWGAAPKCQCQRIKLGDHLASPGR
jgi:hypothetical protein